MRTEDRDTLCFLSQEENGLAEKSAQRVILWPWKEPKRRYKLDMPLVEFEPAISMFENSGLRSDDRCSAKTPKLNGARARFSLEPASKQPAETQMFIRDSLYVSKIIKQVNYNSYVKITRTYFLFSKRTVLLLIHDVRQGGHTGLFLFGLCKCDQTPMSFRVHFTLIKF
jgi:hypothetical protein